MQKLNLEGIVMPTAKRNSQYDKLYNFIPQMEKNEWYRVEAEHGYDSRRTASHNKTNILSCIGKKEELRRFQVEGVVLPIEGVEVFAIRRTAE